MPGSIEPMSSRPSTAAPPRVPRRSASRAVSAAGPPRARATSSACLTSKSRSPRSFDAEPSTPRPTGTRASSSSRVRAMPAPRRMFDVGQCATPTLAPPNGRMSSSFRWTQCAHQTSSRDPAELLEVLDRAAAVELPAVVVLLDRLREVRVEPQAAPPRELRGFAHQASRHRERRARRDDDLAGIRVRESLRLGEHRVDVLDELVRRQASLRLAEVHRAARRDRASRRAPARPAAPPRSGRSSRAGRRSGGRRRSCSRRARARRGPCARRRRRTPRRCAAHTG